MSDTPDFDREDRPGTAQPPPVHVPGAPSVHDLVIADLDVTKHPELVKLLAERKAFGLRKYQTVLQVEDPSRDATQDLLEELGDAIVYAYRAAACGAIGGEHVYRALLDFTGSVTSLWAKPAGEGRA